MPIGAITPKTWELEHRKVHALGGSCDGKGGAPWVLGKTKIKHRNAQLCPGLGFFTQLDFCSHSLNDESHLVTPIEFLSDFYWRRPNTPAGGASTAADRRRLRRPPGRGCWRLCLQFEVSGLVVGVLVCVDVCVCVCCVLVCVCVCSFVCVFVWLFADSSLSLCFFG